MEKFHLIAGLGNPGAQYARTRHNIGFLAVERCAVRHQADWALEDKFNARLARAEIAGQKVLLCEPQTYMNSSGTAVRALIDYFKIGNHGLLIVVDDADLPFGEIRMRASGSSGGHHGLESVEQQLATRNYPRLRIGIGRQASGVRQITDYVLGKFRLDERETVDSILDRVANQMECWLAFGIQKAMNEFNGAIKSPMPKES